MPTDDAFMPAGYSKVRRGQIAAVVTCLEMLERPKPKPVRPQARPLHLAKIDDPDLHAYRALFRRIGTQWLWFSRVVMPDDKLRSILADPMVDLYVLREGNRDIGLLELDFRDMPNCELAFFGLVPEAIGGGAGRFLMDQALAKAWARPISRLWVHTCTYDHPGAVDFYRRTGFRPYALEVEIADDPRLSGHLPRDAAPHVPIIE